MCVNFADQTQSVVREITTLKMQIQQFMKGNHNWSYYCIYTLLNKLTQCRQVYNIHGLTFTNKFCSKGKSLTL